jgi:hypothetical protein
MKLTTLFILNDAKFNLTVPCQIENSVFTTLSGCSRVQCGGLCDSNSFGRCGRFIWDQDSRTCMLHSSTIFPNRRNSKNKSWPFNLNPQLPFRVSLYVLHPFPVLTVYGLVPGNIVLECNIHVRLSSTLCDKVCQWLATGQGFSPGTPVSSTIKTDRHDITEILLKIILTV